MGKPSDPEVYATAIVGLLAKYPDEVVMKVCDPLNGLPTKSKFLPSVAELKDALGAECAVYWKKHRPEPPKEQPNVISLEERARVSARFQELILSIGGSK